MNTPVLATYCLSDSPLGALSITASARGITQISLRAGRPEQVGESAAASLDQQAAQEITEYCAGQRQHFSVPLDLSGAHCNTSAFRRRCWEAIAAIAYGHTCSYQDIARILGNAQAARAVGTACKHNPVPILIPCHRIIKADRAPGAYVGGAARKAWLLELEAAHRASAS